MPGGTLIACQVEVSGEFPRVGDVRVAGARVSCGSPGPTVGVIALTRSPCGVVREGGAGRVSAARGPEDAAKPARPEKTCGTRAVRIMGAVGTPRPSSSSIPQFA